MTRRGCGCCGGGGCGTWGWKWSGTVWDHTSAGCTSGSPVYPGFDGTTTGETTSTNCDCDCLDSTQLCSAAPVRIRNFYIQYKTFGEPGFALFQQNTPYPSPAYIGCKPQIINTTKFGGGGTNWFFLFRFNYDSATGKFWVFVLPWWGVYDPYQFNLHTALSGLVTLTSCAGYFALSDGADVAGEFYID